MCRPSAPLSRQLRQETVSAESGRIVIPATQNSESLMVQSSEDQNDGFVVPIRGESDLNHARVLAREICNLVEVRGYQAQKVVTAVSELARNITRYTDGGRLRFRVDATAEAIIVVAEDDGPGIPNLEEILSGGYKSRSGLGRGLLGSRQLADHFDIQTAPEGTTVTVAFCYGQNKQWKT